MSAPDGTARTRPRVLVATGNAHKLAEFRRLLGADLDIVGFAGAVPPTDAWDVTPSALVEDGLDFAANARLKALHASTRQPLPVLADDSGLLVDALGGSPGVLSARWGGPGLDDRARYELVLRDMAPVPDGERTARFVAAVTLAVGSRVVATAQGECRGRILRAPTGDGGFGYDPIFFVADAGTSMARLTPVEKDRVSHRARALAELRDELRALWAES